jgi:hypothetical protein
VDQGRRRRVSVRFDILHASQQCLRGRELCRAQPGPRALLPRRYAFRRPRPARLPYARNERGPRCSAGGSSLATASPSIKTNAKGGCSPSMLSTHESRRMFFPPMPVMNSRSSQSKTNQTGSTCGFPDRCGAGASHEPAAARDRGNESGAATRIGGRVLTGQK